jgi:hypothetical protein
MAVNACPRHLVPTMLEFREIIPHPCALLPQQQKSDPLRVAL